MAEDEIKTEFIKDLSEALGQSQFYIELKASRYGLDKDAIGTSIAGDQAACEKIALDLNQDAKAVWREFIGQLSRWKSTFSKWKVPTPPEEMVINSLRNIMAQRYVGKTVRLAVIISMDKTKTANSAQNSKFRWLQIMVEPDQPGKPWEIKRVIHWGSAPAVEFGAPYNIVLVEKGDFTTLTELALSDKKLPDPIPGDIRARCKLIAIGQPYTRRGTTERGDYELEGIYVTLLVANKDGTTSLIEGSSLKPDAWLKAPHGKIINTTIVEKKGFINIGDWHEAKDQSPIKFPVDIPLLADLSDETAEVYLEEFVIYDAIPSRFWIAEGEKGPVQLLTIESFFSKPTTVRIMENADIDRSMIKEEGANIIFDATRVRVLCKIQQYQKNQQVRLSRTAYAVWAVSEQEAEESTEEVILPASKVVPEEPPAIIEDSKNVIPEGFILDTKTGTLKPIPEVPASASSPRLPPIVDKEEDPLIDRSQKMDFSKDPLLDKDPVGPTEPATRPNLKDLGAPLTASEVPATEEKRPARKPRFLSGEPTQEKVL